MSSNIPERLATALSGTYRLERELGQGGMAVVYLATDLKHDRRVAFKVMRSEMKGVLGPRFAREIKLAARLQHPHICSVYDSGETPEGELWYTMPFVEGESLRDRLTAEPRLPIPTAVRIAREAAQGLEYAHKHGTIHRDIKPENILLTEDGKTLVADFGIARALGGSGGASGDAPNTVLTEAGVAIGTPAYMPPEQRMGETVTAASDVFSLGAVLYEMLAGERAASMTSMQSLLAQMSDPAPRVKLKRTDVSTVLDGVIQTAMHPDPTKRYQSMAAFDAALEGAVSGQFVAVSSTSSRRRVLLGVISVAIVAFGALAWSRLHKSAGPETVTVLPFTLPESLGDSTLAYFTGSVGEDLRRMIGHVPGMSANTEAAVAYVSGGRLTAAEIAAKMGSSVVVQPTAAWTPDSNVALSFTVSRAPFKESNRVEFQGTPQWIVSHRDSLVTAVMAAGGRSLDHEQAAALVRWGIATTSAPAYIHYWKYAKAMMPVTRSIPQWGPIVRAWQDTLLRYDPRFIDAIADKIYWLGAAIETPGMFPPAVADSLRRELAADMRRANQIDPTHPLTLMASGNMSLLANDTTAALRSFKEAARQNPAFLTLYAVCIYEEESLRPSQPLPESCHEMLRSDSLNPSNLSVMAYLLMTTGRADAAIEPARRLAELGNRDPTFRGVLVQALMTAGRDEEAIVELRRILVAMPKDPYYLELMRELQWHLGLTTEAIATSREMLALNPDYLPNRAQLAAILTQAKQFPEAIALARENVKRAPASPDDRARLGGILFRAGQFDEGLTELRKAVDLQPDNIQWRATLASFLRLAGHAGDAQGVVDELQRRAPESAMALAEQARQLAWMGRDAASVPVFRRMMGTDTLNAGRWNSIGYAQILAGQLDSAVITMRRAMALDSFNTSVLSNTALAQSEQGAFRAAAQTSDRMRSRQPLDHDAMAQQIWFHARAGDKDLARAMLDTLQQRWQRNGVSELPLVIAFAGVSDTAAARAALRRSVEARDYGWTSFSLQDPLFRSLRGTPEFAEAVRAFRQAGDH